MAISPARGFATDEKESQQIREGKRGRSDSKSLEPTNDGMEIFFSYLPQIPLRSVGNRAMDQMGSSSPRDGAFRSSRQ
jgi:hypothetical protein